MRTARKNMDQENTTVRPERRKKRIGKFYRNFRETFSRALNFRENQKRSFHSRSKSKLKATTTFESTRNVYTSSSHR